MDQSSQLLLELAMSNMVYSDKIGLKLMRYGKPGDRFDQTLSFHYSKPPVARGTWATIYPYSPILGFPDQRDSKHLDIRDQSSQAHAAFGNDPGNPFLKPLTFYWHHDIYSHIDRLGMYQNTGWTYYQNVRELAAVIRNNYAKLTQSVEMAKSKTKDYNFPDSDTRYFHNHEFEVFVPHESITTSNRSH